MKLAARYGSRLGMISLNMMEKVDAPYKRMVWFERSAHMIPWEEPGKLLVSLLEVVRPLVR